MSEGRGYGWMRNDLRSKNFSSHDSSKFRPSTLFLVSPQDVHVKLRMWIARVRFGQ